MGELENKIVMWRNELERQQANLGVMSVFDSICVFLGEQQRKIAKAHCRELSYIDDIKNYQLMEEILLGRLKKLEGLKTKTTHQVYEENLRLAQELALIKGELSG